MQWVRDNTGRFAKRPHYLPEELDRECETVINNFLVQKYRALIFPVTTDDLTCLLEREVKDLDLYADFSGEEGEIEGVTEFRIGEKPTVRIASRLAETANLENRFRTTLTHEFGHVHFHNYMFQVEAKPASLFPEPSTPATLSHANRCNRDSMFSNDKRDWMEWQAGFVCGAILMPVTSLSASVEQFRANNDLDAGPLSEGSPAGAQLVADVARVFQTSKDAARVRLLQTKILSTQSLETLL
jgi:IrrE N-terminal-like domain